MNNYKIVVEYAGERYHGFAKQPGLETIQGVLEETLSKILKEDVYTIGAGRTDAKVHAINQVVNFETNLSIKDVALLEALNSNLPRDIVAKSVEIVDKDFHARYSAKSKKYMYIINNNEIPSAFALDREYFCKYKLNVEKIKEAALTFKGKHNFSAFVNVGGVITDTVREIYDVEVIIEGGIIKIIFTGEGFLYNQVRIMVGTLIEVGRGIKEVSDVKKIIDLGDRKLAGATAKPEGLYLLDVIY